MRFTVWMLVAAAGVTLSAQSADEKTIRESRAASNAAIAKHDAAGIARFWMDDIHITTSTSAQAAGRAPNQDRMAQQFQRRPDTIYVRTPSTIDVFSAWSVASERGEWTGRWTEPDGKVEISGTNGYFRITPQNHSGLDATSRSFVMLRSVKGKWVSVE